MSDGIGGSRRDSHAGAVKTHRTRSLTVVLAADVAEVVGEAGLGARSARVLHVVDVVREVVAQDVLAPVRRPRHAPVEVAHLLVGQPAFPACPRRTVRATRSRCLVPQWYRSGSAGRRCCAGRTPATNRAPPVRGRTGRRPTPTWARCRDSI